jgi:hypothetical protein
MAIRRPRTLEKNGFSDNHLDRREEFVKRQAATST